LPQSNVGEQPAGLAVADFNGDGLLDLAVTNYVQSTLSVILSLGDAGVDGGFAPQVLYATGSMPRYLVADDFTGDGRQDLAIPIYDSSVPGQGGPIAIYPNLGTWDNGGDGGFGAPELYPTPVACPEALAVVDLNKDGWPDLVFTDSCNRQIGLMLNLTDGGGFTQPVAFPASTDDLGFVAVGDVNGDGWPDVVATSPIYGAIFVFPNTQDWSSSGASGLGTPQILPNDNDPYGVAVGDFNGDGWLDFVVAEHSSNTGMGTAGLYLNLRDGGFGPRLPFFVGGLPDAVAVADFNRDGLPDFAAATGSSTVVLLNTGNWASNGGDAGFGPVIIIDAGTSATGVQVADFNGDGWPDLAVVRGDNDGSTSVFINSCGP
jgi:FG-GAP-like repeat